MTLQVRKIDMATATTVPTWQLKGTMVQACNCEYGCPCEFNAPPSQGYCEGTWSWHVTEGRFGDVDLAGLHFAAACKWPGQIHEGNGEALPILDERASQAQIEAVGALLGGQAGGPWGIIASTLVKVHEPKLVRWDVALAGTETSIKAGDVLTMELAPMRNPVTGETHEASVVLPTGFISRELHHATTSDFSVRDGVAYAYPGKDAAWGDFEYSGPPS
jgi:hypothetical protein